MFKKSSRLKDMILGKEIDVLNEINNKDTFIRLYERAHSILTLIEQSERLLNTKVVIAANELEKNGISFFLISKIYLEHASVLYRSMFQKANWENGSFRFKIKPAAFNIVSASMLSTHDEIIIYVDKVLAHQDIDCGEIRHLYPPHISDTGMSSYLFCNRIKFLPETMKPNIMAMVSALQLAFMSKFNEPLLLFNEVYGINKFYA